ncbi:MAG: toll/interleukin-1 receptor domain-containing protein, partial [Gaiellaceae bacterium]
MAGHGRYDAFISYKSVDVRVARELADQLIASGRRVWFAEYEILLSNFDEFQQSVLEGLRRSKRAIAITSDLYTQSQYCAVELATLMERVGPGRILEVRLPGEHESHRLFPELSHSPQCTSRDTAEILSFVA